MVLAAARVVGERHGLDERWLDLGAAQFVPRGDDIRAKTIHNSPGLVVTGASAEYRLAMKVFAGRRPDLNDIKHLAGILGITRTSDAIRICERAYPGLAGHGEDAQERHRRDRRRARGTRRASARADTRERHDAVRRRRREPQVRGAAGTR